MEKIILDRNSRYPLYLQAADRLRERLDAGLFSKADPLPDERSLSRMMGINRMTLRKSLSVLENEGLIYKIKGSGIFVKDSMNRKKSGDVRLESFNRRLLGISVPENIELHYSRVMEKGAVDKIHNSGFHAVVLRYMDSEDRKKHIARWQDVLSGLILFRSQAEAADSDIIMFVKSLGLPVVAMGAAELGNADFDQIGADNKKGSALACRHLLDTRKNKNPVAMVRLPYGRSTVSDRVAGYLESIKAAGEQPVFIEGGSASDFKQGPEKDINLMMYGYVAAENAFKRANSPSGILCESDLLAVGVLNALQEMEVKVPEDVQVFGFGDDLEMHSYYSERECPLSSVSVPRAQEGAFAAEVLLSRVSGDSCPPRKKLLDLKIIHRKSTLIT